MYRYHNGSKEIPHKFPLFLVQRCFLEKILFSTYLFAI